MTENPVITIRPGLVRPRLLSLRKAQPPLNIKISDNAEKKPMLRIKITDQVITNRSSEALSSLKTNIERPEGPNITKSQGPTSHEPNKKLPLLLGSEPNKKLPVLKNVKPKKSVKTEIIYDLLEHKPPSPKHEDEDEDQDQEEDADAVVKAKLDDRARARAIATARTDAPEGNNLGKIGALFSQEESPNKPLANPYLISTAPLLGCSSFRIMSETKVRKEVHAPPDTQPVKLEPIVIANNIYLICHENHCIYNTDNEEKIGIINNDRSIFWYD
ncbi:MAG: hypothetical protein WD512_15245 [Candidatus Paceibacterota bacterium]